MPRVVLHVALEVASSGVLYRRVVGRLTVDSDGYQARPALLGDDDAPTAVEAVRRCLQKERGHISP